MRVFKKANFGTRPCPICKTKDDGEVVLVGIEGTEKGCSMEAVQVHVKCLDLLYNKKKGIIYQII